MGGMTMPTQREVHSVIIELLGQIAPEVDVDALDPGADLREELDIDSYDYLNFIVGISDRLGIEVPEADYARLSTLAGCESYLVAREPA